MKRVSTLIAAILFSVSTLIAQDAKPDTKQSDEVVNRDFRNTVFTVQHRDPRSIASAIKLLGSGSRGADLNVNDVLRTITVRDFPENLASMADAIKRLDQPAAEPAIDLQMWVLIGSKLPIGKSTLPDELAPVVKQLEGSLAFTHYGLISSTIHRTKAGENLEGSGVAEPLMLGLAGKAAGPLFFEYHLRRLATTTLTEKPSVQVESFRFLLRYPMSAGTDTKYRDIGFNIPVMLRSGEKVVIGATHLGDKALIVVVTATIVP